MEFNSQDHDIVKLLTKLKNNKEAYPSDLLVARRQKYIRRVAEVGVGIGVAPILQKTIKGKGISATAGGLLETALIAAIVIEAGAAAYFYRAQIADIVESYTSQTQVQEVTPDLSSSAPGVSDPSLTDIPEAAATPIPSGTPTVTPTLFVAGATATSGDTSADDTSIQANSTPNPNGNSGNHFGQTPKPDRTKESGGGGNDGDNGNGKDK